MKNKILLLLALLLATASPHAFAQSRHTVAADAFFQAGEYFGALEKYKIAFAKENNRDQTSRIMFQLGECHRLMNQPVEAEEWFFKAIEARYQNTDVFLRYAQTLHKNAKYDEALAQFEEYARLVPNDPRADVGIQACEMARQWLEKPQRWEIANVAELNSPQSDFAPTFADKDQSLLYFTSTRDAATGNDINGVVGLNFSDIFMARLDRKDKWSEPVPAPGAINTPFDEGSAAFAPGFTQIYYTQCLQDRRQDLGCRLWWANLSDTAWAAPTEMDLVSDSSITLGHPALSPDGLALYFSSDMDGGRGGKDLWVMRRAATSASWGRPTNLGPEVNTPGDELFPAVAPDGTLHFASDYHPGMGGLDIFRAPRENGKHKVENLGFPLNTNADDFGITFFPEANRGFFSSTREGGRGSDDIYSFFLPALEFDLLVWVYDEESREPLANASVALTGSDGTQLAATTDDKGNARFDLKPETDYQLLATLERHLNGKAEESTKALAESMTLEAQIFNFNIKSSFFLIDYCKETFSFLNQFSNVFLLSGVSFASLCCRI